MYDLLSGRVEIQRLRPVRLEDLLARDPVKTDTTQVQTALRGKRVLVTGAGGSIGSELCRFCWGMARTPSLTATMSYTGPFPT
jgi:FlaA1/EpsC-like NDP-sugar epimerase